MPGGGDPAVGQGSGDLNQARSASSGSAIWRAAARLLLTVLFTGGPSGDGGRVSEGLVQAGADGDQAVQGGEGEDAADLGAGDRQPAVTGESACPSSISNSSGLRPRVECSSSRVTM